MTAIGDIVFYRTIDDPGSQHPAIVTAVLDGDVEPYVNLTVFRDGQAVIQSENVAPDDQWEPGDPGHVYSASIAVAAKAAAKPAAPKPSPAPQGR